MDKAEDGISVPSSKVSLKMAYLFSNPAGIKQCRSKKCSSGSACKSEYYSALNYAMDDTDVVEGCTLPVNEFSANELMGRSQVS